MLSRRRLPSDGNLDWRVKMKMNRIQQHWNNPKQRREVMTALSGGLIVAAFIAGALWDAATVRSVLMLAAALIAGADIAVRAMNSLRSRHVSIELLVTIAAGGALVIGEYWEAAAVTFLFLFGAYLEARTLGRTRKVLEDLFDLAPTMAVVLRSARQVEVLPHEVQPGEIVLLKPGSKVPVDGEVLEGHSAVDESAITGEPMPEDKAPGARVFAGTVNMDGLLQVRATGVGADTTLARIIRRVEEAQEAKAPAQRFIERFAAWYTPLIIGLSGLAFLLTRNLELALTLLVIGCPGALVISTPVSVIAGIGRAAQRGILIKGGEHLENAGKISALALDKTGTLTEGRPRVTDIIALQPLLAGAGSLPAGMAGWQQEPSEMEVLRLAARAEAGSEHPLARAILAEAAARLGSEAEIHTLPDGGFQNFTGKGVRAVTGGRTILIGTWALMDELGVVVPDEALEGMDRLKADGKTAVLVAVDGTVTGVLGISDPIRESSAEAVRRLYAAGLKRVLMLTGDDRRTARAIAAEAGIDEVRAGLLPEHKLEAIRELQREGYITAMAGDGINDAPALAAADTGIAMGAAGSGVAIETADIALMADDLLKIPEAIRISKATLGNIRQNVAIALITVAGLLLGVLLGEVNMAGGMLIHEASVLFVILNGMRLLRV